MSRLALIALLTPLLVPAQPDWRFAHPQADFVAGVNMKRFVESPLWDSMQKEVKGTLPPELLGMVDSLKEIDEVWISGLSRDRNVKTKQEDGIVIVRGRLTPQRVKEWLKQPGFTVRNHRSVELLEVQEKSKAGKSMSVALFDANTMLLGEDASLRGAIDRMLSNSATPANPIFARGAEMAAANDFWLIGVSSPKSLGPEDADFLKQGPLADLRSFAMGVSVRDNMNMNFSLNFRTPASAKQLGDGLQTLIGMAVQNAKDPAVAQKFLRTLAMDQQGSTLKMSLSIPRAELEQAMEQARSSFRTGPQVAAQNAAPPPEPERGTVRIYGAIGGTKEIPYSPK
ncbi:MAG: hypothetical protein MUC42_10220 [Bryobacter sp.]|nr:hypothetical protein [Bryobacter sp.]